MLVFVGDRVIPAFTPGMAGKQPFCRQPQSLRYTESIDRFDGILRTGWRIAATTTEVRTDRVLIKAYRQNDQFAHLEIIFCQWPSSLAKIWE